MKKVHFCLLLLLTALITAWDGEKQEKLDLTPIRKTNEESAHYGMHPEASKFFRCYYYRITLLLRHSFFTHIKNWLAKIYWYGSLNTCKFLEPGQNDQKCVWEGIDIYKVFKPASCNFMKKITNLQWFKYLANFVKVNILRNSPECLHMIFVIFFSATILKYKQLKIEFYFANESYNEEQ